MAIRLAIMVSILLLGHIPEAHGISIRNVNTEKNRGTTHYQPRIQQSFEPLNPIKSLLGLFLIPQGLRDRRSNWTMGIRR
jgi:hypothetical protein